MEYRLFEYHLEFRRPFTITHGTRLHTPAVFLELSHEGVRGYGEAALPPYLPETQGSVISFIHKHAHLLLRKPVKEELETTITSLMSVPGNNAAKACMEMALYDLASRLKGVPLSEWLGLDAGIQPACSFTLGAGAYEALKADIDRAAGFSLLKVKLTGEDDLDRVGFVRSHFSGSIAADVNMGWTMLPDALALTEKLKDMGVIFIEQPFQKDDLMNQERFFAGSALPVIADEAIRTPEELEERGKHYHGVNIKLMKSPGLAASLRMIRSAKAKGMKVLVGCMSESSCGVAAAASISSLADWCDLDGPMLIKNDPFSGVSYVNGKICVEGKTGSGVKKKE